MTVAPGHCHSLSLSLLLRRLPMPSWFPPAAVTGDADPRLGSTCVCVCWPSLSCSPHISAGWLSLSDSAISVALASPICVLKLEPFLGLSVFLKMWFGVFLLGWYLLFCGLPGCPGSHFRARPGAVHGDERQEELPPLPPCSRRAPGGHSLA